LIVREIDISASRKIHAHFVGIIAHAQSIFPPVQRDAKLCLHSEVRAEENIGNFAQQFEGFSPSFRLLWVR
jgi:hypothetical protein